MVTTLPVSFRYSPAECVGTITGTVPAAPTRSRSACISYAERANLSIRMGVRRFTRLTNAFFKKIDLRWMMLCASLRNRRIRARLLPANDAERTMPNPNNSGDLHSLRKLLDRLAAVHPKCMPDLIIDQWLHGDPEGRRTIEEEIDRMPKRKNSN
jgi:hypothetical protein